MARLADKDEEVLVFWRGGRRAEEGKEEGKEEGRRDGEEKGEKRTEKGRRRRDGGEETEEKRREETEGGARWWKEGGGGRKEGREEKKQAEAPINLHDDVIQTQPTLSSPSHPILIPSLTSPSHQFHHTHTRPSPPTPGGTSQLSSTHLYYYNKRYTRGYTTILLFSSDKNYILLLNSDKRETKRNETSEWSIITV
ncbi:hypothetical protein DFP72DRAFT_1138563 [Ephemerocybe angulata]|uniref:Uncharacterized protein n=1 Tax=Ephemerocybe angulata TaxID=980116 RepID=A0A8H6M0L4_9AGAR|nr:hypothetical protein DFP72DRAFT_1138563 [Tulosesus angulatus]